MMDIPDDYNNGPLVYVLILSRNITGERYKVFNKL